VPPGVKPEETEIQADFLSKILAHVVQRLIPKPEAPVAAIPNKPKRSPVLLEPDPEWPVLAEVMGEGSLREKLVDLEARSVLAGRRVPRFSDYVVHHLNARFGPESEAAFRDPVPNRSEEAVEALLAVSDLNHIAILALGSKGHVECE